jgi:hypothetical protein
MASILSAGNATNNGASLTGATDGILVVKTGTGAGTTAMTIDASQNVTIAGTLTASGGISGGGNPQMAWATYPTTVFNSTGSSMANTGTGTFNWTCPTGVTKVMVSVIGGGGGGRTSTCNEVGGVGGIAVGTYTVTPGTVYSVTVGAGGTGGSGSATSGGSSSFSSFCSATGGNASDGTTVTVNCGAGTNGNLRNSIAAQVTFVPSAHVPSFNTGGSGNPYYVNNDSAATTSYTWTISSRSGVGAGGQAGGGGVTGIVLITWVG